MKTALNYVLLGLLMGTVIGICVINVGAGLREVLIVIGQGIARGMP